MIMMIVISQYHNDCYFMENDHMIELAWYPLLKAQEIIVHKGGVGNQPKKGGLHRSVLSFYDFQVGTNT
jgi:hypothetical protein